MHFLLLLGVCVCDSISRSVAAAAHLSVCLGPCAEPIIPPPPAAPFLSLPRDLRPQRWKFATGPLPLGLPASRLENEWFLLTI